MNPLKVTWNMLSASEYVTSIMTTLGYGDIVPQTTEGKIFTLGLNSVEFQQTF